MCSIRSILRSVKDFYILNKESIKMFFILFWYVSLSLLSLMTIFLTYDYIWQVIKIDLRSNISKDVVSWIVFGSILLLLSLTSFVVKANASKRAFFLATLFAMYLVFLLGIHFLHQSYGIQDLNLMLRSKDGAVGKRILCYQAPELSQFGWLSDHFLTCDPPQQYKIINSSISLTYLSSGALSLGDTFHFRVPKDTAHIYILMEVVNETNNSFYVETSQAVWFRTISEDIERKNIYINYLFGLLAGIFTIIPAMMVNLYKLLNSSNK